MLAFVIRRTSIYINRITNKTTKMRVAILSGILFLSGISALIFETLWLRLSGLSFGNSIWSAALILSSFMAGMALGNAFAASSRLQRWRPLQLYAFLELVIAFLGCTIIFGLPCLRNGCARFFKHFGITNRSLSDCVVFSRFWCCCCRQRPSD